MQALRGKFNSLFTAHAGAEPYGADRLAGDRAVRPRDAGYGDGKIGTGETQGARRHFARGGLAHRAVLLERAAADSKVTHLGGVRIGDVAALKPLRAAGNVSKRFGQPPARTGLGGDEAAVPQEQQLADTGRERRQ